MGDALFHLEGDGDLFVPTDLTRGPWSPDAQHGGPPAALLTRAIERVEAPGPMQVARLTFELLRPVPMTALRVSTEVLRPGRKVQLAGASLWSGDVEVARANGLRMRAAHLAVPDDVALDEGRPDLPAATEPADFAFPRGDWGGFHRDGVEIRLVAGSLAQPGPATGWIRLRAPVVAGEEPTGAMRAAATADFGNGLSWVLPQSWVFINADLSLHLLRPPAGEWLCLAARTLPSHAGMGIAETAIYDEHGRVGRGVQSLLVEPPS